MMFKQTVPSRTRIRSFICSFSSSLSNSSTSSSSQFTLSLPTEFFSPYRRFSSFAANRIRNLHFTLPLTQTHTLPNTWINRNHQCCTIYHSFSTSSFSSSSSSSSSSPSSFSSPDPESHDDFKPRIKNTNTTFTSPSTSSSTSDSDFGSGSGSGTSAAPESDDDSLSLIKSDVALNPVFLFMKGSPDAPRCGFSANVVKILKHLGAEFSARDVLTDDGIRNAVKQYSDWPTLPQLYVKGEFVGGSDIVTSLFKNGELEKLLTEAGAIRPKSQQ